MNKVYLIVLSITLIVCSASVPLTGLNISNLTQSEGISFYGTFVNGQLGTASSGDFNGDGKTDIILGAFQAAPSGNNNAGAAYVAFGRINLTNPNTNVSYIYVDEIQGFNMSGAVANDRTAHSVSTAGDFNGDGIDDILVGAHRADPQSRNNPGKVYLISGRNNSNTNINLGTSLTGSSRGFSIFGANNDDQLGMRLSKAGDINGDGFADFIIGSYSANPSARNQAGLVYIMFGKAGGYSTDIDLLTDLTGAVGFSILGGYDNDNLGMSVSHAGDINGDGIDDIVISAHKSDPLGRQDAGTIYVIFGRTTGFSNIDLNTTIFNTNTEGFRIFGGQPNDDTGISVSAGDINGDGIDDLIIGASGADSTTGGIDAGVVYGIYGRKGGFVDIDLYTDLRNTSLGFNISGANPGDCFGSSVSGLGDVNGDGIDDFVIGATKVDSFGVIDSGAAYVIYGKKGRFADIDLNTTQLTGTQGFMINGVGQDDNMGYAVNKAGDVNGDGIGDILIVARMADISGKADAGAVYLVYGFNTTVPKDFSAAAAIGAFLGSASQGSSAAASLISLVNFNNPGAICFSSLAAGLGYIKYIKINYPSNIKYLIDQPEPETDPLSSLVSPIELLKDKIRKYPLPEVFEEDNLHSSFLINFWPSLFNILLVTAFIILISIINAGLDKNNFLHKIFANLKSALKWNYFFVAFTGYYGDIALYGSLELRSLHFQSFLEFPSFFLCISVNVLMIAILAKMILVVKDLMNAKNLAKRTQNNKEIAMVEEGLKEYEAVFKSFKSDSFFKQSFFIIFCLRQFLFYIILGYLFDYPLFQMFIINIMGISMLLYIVLLRPPKEKMETFQYFIQELIFQVVHVCTLGLAMIDSMDSDDPETRENLGSVIMYSYLVFMIVGLIFMGLSMLGILIDIVKFIRRKLRERTMGSKIQKANISIKIHPSTQQVLSVLDVPNKRNYTDQSPSILQGLNDSRANFPHFDNSFVTNTPNDIFLRQSWYGMNNNQLTENQLTQGGHNPNMKYRSRLSSQIINDQQENLSSSSFRNSRPKVVKPQKVFNFSYTEEEYAAKMRSQNSMLSPSDSKIITKSQEISHSRSMYNP